LDGRRGGFRIVYSGAEKVPEKPRLKISVGYDLPSGNPIKRWSPFDFEFGKSENLTFSGEGVSVHRLAGNILALDVTAEKFSFAVDGFDEHRDLLVRIDEMNEEVEAEEIQL
jgi:hypothetical protein